MKPVDTHCHLNFERFDDDREKVIERSKKELEFVVNAGNNTETNRKTLKLEKDHPDFIIPNLGLHPTYTDNFNQLKEIKQMIREEDPVAVGEIGLDHHRVKQDKVREKQEQVFREMLELAEELDKPVVIHSREAEKKVFEIVQEYSIPEIMFHCFNGDPELAEKATEENIKIGFTTQVLYSNKAQKLVKRIELDDILLETDSPFLYRGDRNEPLNVKESAEKIADIKQVKRQKVVEKTTQNARNIFHES
ncbi:MAG: DNase [Nanohaloarchaea archaeon SW_7_43_1]|nr:MAG: DNase [Nanohaloarchaea archaeon SW_7_43_1]